MQTRVWLSLIGALVLFSTASAQVKFDACSLITRAEIEAVQGEPVIDTKSSEPDRPMFAVSQCFYTVTTFSKSVSLELTRKDPEKPAKEGPRDQWKKLFHPAADKEVEGDREKEGEKESAPPRRVKGVGDEAFWMGTAITGALYVLKGDAYLRISIGGGESESVRIQKIKTLARKALTRL